MGQTEIIKWLMKERKVTDKYFTVKEISLENEFNSGDLNLCARKLKQLYNYGFLDREYRRISRFGGLRPVYRMKKSRLLAHYLVED